VWRAENISMSWAEKAAAGKTRPDAALPSESPAGSPPSLKGSEAPCSPHHAPPRSNWTSISATAALIPPRHGVAVCRLPPPYGPRWGLGTGTACGPGAKVPRGPGWWAPLHLQHLAAHCLGSGMTAWVLGATLLPQLAAGSHESAFCCEGRRFVLMSRRVVQSNSPPRPRISFAFPSSTSAQRHRWTAAVASLSMRRARDPLAERNGLL
jgi:hypothetical protein